MSIEPYIMQDLEPEWVEKLLRRIDTSEALDIEDYLERKTMLRLALLAHYKFMESMQGMSDMPVQPWEWEVSSYMRVWV